MPLTSPQNGTVTRDKKIIEQIPLYITNYKCNQDYRLEGSPFRQCNPKASLFDQKSGKVIPRNRWTGEDPLCLKSMSNILTAQTSAYMHIFFDIR